MRITTCKTGGDFSPPINIAAENMEFDFDRGALYFSIEAGDTLVNMEVLFSDIDKMNKTISREKSKKALSMEKVLWKVLKNNCEYHLHNGPDFCAHPCSSRLKCSIQKNCPDIKETK